MGLASGGNTTGSFDFELFHETRLILFYFYFFLALVPVRLCKHKYTSLEMWQLPSKSWRRTFGVRLRCGLRDSYFMSSGCIIVHCCSSPPTEPAHYAGDGLLCQERGRLIEKLNGKQIFSIWFRRLCPLTVRANVLVAVQSTSHCASDNRGGRNHSVFVRLSQGFFRLFGSLY